ncbi:hypothetical protein [Rhizobium sp. Root1220]|uniref:hypothetical protein n=1 Tax=Rhizobium sp. Root1220 TaxID=1736432 RepID=UPI0006F3FCD4|nr:hypothetical protein [Rhizobium sp. Root1220]KQV84362.1 hypothetical protein ASC90_02240 [Rhizobium sp. Root1220]
MLTPVRAASNASFPSQGQNTSLSADGIVRSVNAVPPVNLVESPDLNSPIVAKLNILVLAVRARMVEALLDALDAAGAALSQPRDEDENDLVFASRLASAIQKLPAAKIEAIERQLAADGHSVPLRLLAEALKNPTGPEAARIAAYLETTRYKDRDPAARAVVRSYGQNDASPPRQEPRPEISLHRSNLPVAARTAAAIWSDGEPDAPTGSAALADAYIDHERAERPAAFDNPAAEGREVAGDAKAAAANAGQVGLQEAPETEGPLQPMESDAQAASATASVEEGSLSVKNDPVIPKSWAGIPATMSHEATDVIVAIIRDQEAEVPLNAAGADPAVEIDVILDETRIVGDSRDGLTPTNEQTLLQKGIARPSSPLAPQASMEGTPATASTKPAPETHPQHVVQPTIDVTYAPVLMKIVEGVPYAPQPYEFAKDETEDGSRAMHREDHDSGPQSEQQHADDEADGSGDDEATSTDISADPIDGRAEGGRPPLRPAPGLPTPSVADEAYTRYRRLVDWE